LLSAWFDFAHGCSRFAGLRGRALPRGGHSALPRLRLAAAIRPCLGCASGVVNIAHGCSCLRQGLRGRALPRGGHSALPRLRLGSQSFTVMFCRNEPIRAQRGRPLRPGR